jgi:hypothetical protein
VSGREATPGAPLAIDNTNMTTPDYAFLRRPHNYSIVMDVSDVNTNASHGSDVERNVSHGSDVEKNASHGSDVEKNVEPYISNESHVEMSKWNETSIVDYLPHDINSTSANYIRLCNGERLVGFTATYFVYVFFFVFVLVDKTTILNRYIITALSMQMLPINRAVTQVALSAVHIYSLRISLYPTREHYEMCECASTGVCMRGRVCGEGGIFFLLLLYTTTTTTLPCCQAVCICVCVCYSRITRCRY